ncbi:MAG: AAA family ATPase, partial [Planctomycetota bacterium]
MNEETMTDAWASSPENQSPTGNGSLAPAEISLAKAPFERAIDEIGRSIVGQEKLVHRMMVALLTGGHLLIEGVPGLAKTTAVSALSQVTGLSDSRLQFTPDLLPADLIGTQVYRPSEEKFVVQKGPVFANLVLADEINR